MLQYVRSTGICDMVLIYYRKIDIITGVNAAEVAAYGDGEETKLTLPTYYHTFCFLLAYLAMANNVILVCMLTQFI